MSSGHLKKLGKTYQQLGKQLGDTAVDGNGPWWMEVPDTGVRSGRSDAHQGTTRGMYTNDGTMSNENLKGNNKWDIANGEWNQMCREYEERQLKDEAGP